MQATPTPAPWQDAYGEHGTLINSGEFDGLDFAGAFDAIEVALIKKELGALAYPVPPARLGHQPSALLGLPDPDHPLHHLR